jgi:hypothetical protein
VTSDLAFPPELGAAYTQTVVMPPDLAREGIEVSKKFVFAC